MKAEKQALEISEVPHLDGKEFVNGIPEGKKLVLFLDFDGTLSPIVNIPDEAALMTGMREVIAKCLAKYEIAVVSGRDTDDVRARIGLDGIIYAGSHGFSIRGPGDLRMEHPQADQISGVLDNLEVKLHDMFSEGPDGIHVERKKYAITVHFRNADPSDTDEIIFRTGRAVEGLNGLRREMGKKIVEIRPDIEWHKGMAVKWIMEQLGYWDDPEILPLYIGDDVTDEDAFRMLGGKGIGIIVGSHDQPTAADFRLDDVVDVMDFLRMMA